MASGAIFHGRYRLQTVLGAGSDRVIWEAEDAIAGGVVALKLMALASERARRMELEADIARRLAGPHVPSVLAAGAAEGFAFIAMERLLGEDLASKLDREGRLTRDETAALAIDLGEGLERAHTLGLIHRDLKPKNLFLSRGPRGTTLKILDFGVAKRESEARGTTSDALLGTPHYAAPEQLDDPRQVDRRADVYSMAAVLYRCLLGVRPFEGSGAALLAAVRRGRPPLPTSLETTLTSDVDLALLRGLARNKRDRFGSARELAEAFVTALRACRPRLG